MKRLSAVFILLGSAGLIWAVWLWIGGALLNWYDLRRFDRDADGRNGAAQSLPRAPLASSHAPPPDGSVLGRLDIPRLQISTIVLQGDGSTVLRAGSGHIPETPLPGEDGNMGIAAHRDTFFRPLRKIAIGDKIEVTTAGGEYEYAVQSTEIVRPDDVGVLRNSSRPELTLVTCYPFYYVGPAPLRFIVHARQVRPESVSAAAQNSRRASGPERHSFHSMVSVTLTRARG